MGIFRYETRHAVPTKELRNRYMKGERKELAFGPGEKILLAIYDEAAYLRDDISGVRILFTGVRDKQKAYEEARQLAESHEEK